MNTFNFLEIPDFNSFLFTSNLYFCESNVHLNSF